MNKSIFSNAVGIALMTFFSALAGALYVGHLYSERAWDAVEADRQVLANMINQYYAEEFLLSIGVGNIQMVREENFDDFYRINCFIIRSQLSRVNPDRVSDDARGQEISDQLAQARDLLRTLEEEGVCPSNK